MIAKSTTTPAPVRSGALGSGHGERAVKLAATLYAARDSMRSFCGDKYAEEVAKHQNYIRVGMKKWKCDEMQSVMKLVAELVDRKLECGITTAILLASYVEMIEPSAQNISADRP